MTRSARNAAASAHAIAPREFQVLRLLQRGRSTSQVAASLGITRSTANFHRREGYAKLGIATRAELLRISLPAARDLRRERPRRVPPGGRAGDVTTCEWCGREFRTWQRRPRPGHGRFCSTGCSSLARAAAHRAAAEVRRCLVCARPFVPHHSWQRHCSRACSRVTADAKIRELGRARRLPADEKAERLRTQWRDAKRRRRRAGPLDAPVVQTAAVQ